MYLAGGPPGKLKRNLNYFKELAQPAIGTDNEKLGEKVQLSIFYNKANQSKLKEWQSFIDNA